MNQFRTNGYAFLFIFILGFSNVQAGDLEDFEKDATTVPPDKNAETHKPRHTHANEHDHSDDFFSILFGDLVDTIVSEVVSVGAEMVGQAASVGVQMVGQAVTEGGSNSNERVDDSVSGALQKRKLGEPLIPYFRLNLNVQNISSNIYGFDGKIELGLGALGGEYRETRYRDQEHHEQLKLQQIQALYRMSFGNQIGINFGLGVASLDGTKHSQGTMSSIALIYHPLQHLAFEIRPSWLSSSELSVNELDLSTLIAYKRMAFRIGYRQLDSSSDSLNGAYAGIDYIF